MIPYGRHSIDEEDIAAVVDVLRGDWLTGGPAVSHFEEVVKNYVGVKHAIAVSNGTAALHLAALAAEVGSGDVGITSPITFLASANSIAYCGGRPDFVDVDLATHCISPDLLEQYINDHGVPKIVIPVDFGGVPADLPKIWGLANKYGFVVVEDAAHSIGSAYTYEGVVYKCGSCAHSDMAIFSFHPVKTVTAGEGGMVLTNSDKFAKIVRSLASHGMFRNLEDFQSWAINNHSGSLNDLVSSNSFAELFEEKAPWLYQQQYLGYNYRITDIQCALGASQFQKIDAIKGRRREIYDKYIQGLSGCDITIQDVPAWADPAFHLFVMNMHNQEQKIDRLNLFMKLRAEGIFAQVHYIPVYLQPWYASKHNYQLGKCKNAEYLYGRTVSLPLYPGISDDSVKNVIKIINDAYRK